MKNKIIPVLLSIKIAILFCSNTTTASPLDIKSMSELKISGIQRQTKDYSCGASALSILLKLYYNDDIEEIDILSDIVYRLNNKEVIESMTKGFSIYDLKLASERFGYSATGIKMTLDSARKLAGPVILLLKDNSYNHFVILRGISQGRAFITDPAKGNYRIQTHVLIKKWHGETLIIGRNGYGLPQEHGLSYPVDHRVAPERNTVRALLYSPLN